ncbi:MAG: hypothetical protein V7742_13970 [Halioglobus sp.]
MHPDAPAGCSGGVVDSHSIQRKGPLKKIVSDNNHVLHFAHSGVDSSFGIEEIGWRRASIFPGFCGEHDSELFKNLEHNKFDGSHEQCVLQAFRNLCNERYRKLALIESIQALRQSVDRGYDRHRQIEVQLGFAKTIDNSTLSLEELTGFLVVFEKAVKSGNFDSLSSSVYFFEGDLSVVSSSAFQVEYDFSGNQLADLYAPGVEPGMISHSIMATNTGGAIVFCWPAGDADAATLVQSFEDIADDEKGDVFTQYCFLNAENTYFSRVWWEDLSVAQRAYIRTLSQSHYYDGGRYSAREERLVVWDMS